MEIKKRFRYSVNTNSLPKGMSISEKVKLVSKIGFEGIEWGLPKIEEAKKIAKEMVKITKEEGLVILSFLNAGPFWKKELLIRWSELAAENGVNQMRVSTPWIAFNYQESLHQKETASDLFLRMKEKLYQAIEIGKQYKVKYLLETHMGSLLASPFAAKEFLKGLEEKYVGIIYDPANTAVEGGYRPKASVEFLGKYLSYLHAKNIIWINQGSTQDKPVRTIWNWQVCSLSEGLVDYVEVFFALKVTNWSGWISLEEFFSNEPEKALKSGLDFLKECERASPETIQEPFLTFND